MTVSQKFQQGGRSAFEPGISVLKGLGLSSTEPILTVQSVHKILLTIAIFGDYKVVCAIQIFDTDLV